MSGEIFFVDIARVFSELSVERGVVGSSTVGFLVSNFGGAVGFIWELFKQL